MDTCQRSGVRGWAVGGRFVDALARRDFEDLGACLDPDVAFRGLLPRGPFEVAGRDAVTARFRGWFGGPDDFEVIDATVGEVGPKLYLRWRVVMAPGMSSGPSRIAEQHVFAVVDGSIVSLDLLCSGFSEAHPAVPTGRA